MSARAVSAFLSLSSPPVSGGIIQVINTGEAANQPTCTLGIQPTENHSYKIPFTIKEFVFAINYLMHAASHLKMHWFFRCAPIILDWFQQIRLLLNVVLAWAGADLTKVGQLSDF